jgi:hypothetical protein
MEEMIWQDGYVAYVCEWKMVGERESRVLGRKETPISKSSCRPVTVGWSQGFHGNGELLVIYPV